jgi:hypothetical protein
MRKEGSPELRGTYEQWLSEFSVALEDCEQYYTEEEPANELIAVFASAAKTALHTEFLMDVTHEMFTEKPGIQSHYAVNKVLRGIVADQLQHNSCFPENFATQKPWLDAFNEINSDNRRKQSLMYNVSKRELQSNVADRYKTVKFLGALMGDRWDGAPSHLDVGSSRLHGDKKLVYENDPVYKVGRFGHMEILETTAYTDFRRNAYLSTLANMAVAESIEFGAVTGIDITNINNPRVGHWAKSCSLKPNELLIPEKKQEYELLDRIDPHHERIGFFRGDFSSNTDVRAFRQWSPVRSYDIITFSTVFYQGSKNKRHNMLVNAINMLSEDGIILVQDAPDGNFEKSFNYYSSVVDGLNINAGEQKILRWENGRCKRALLEDGRLIYPGGEQTTETALREYGLTI